MVMQKPPCEPTAEISVCVNCMEEEEDKRQDKYEEEENWKRMSCWWNPNDKYEYKDEDKAKDEEKDTDDVEAELLMEQRIFWSLSVATLDLLQSWHHTSQIPQYFDLLWRQKSSNIVNKNGNKTSTILIFIFDDNNDRTAENLRTIIHNWGIFEMAAANLLVMKMTSWAPLKVN